MKLPNESAASPLLASNESHSLEGSQFIVKRIGPPLAKRLDLSGSDEIRDMWRDSVASRDCFDPSKESIVLVALNASCQFLGWHLITTGTANSAHAGPRDVLRAALKIDASCIVLVHNHPSGDVYVSRPDVDFTRAIGEACVVVGVELLDHVVVNSEGTKSHSMRGSHPEMFHRTEALLAERQAGKPARQAAEKVEVKISLPRAFTNDVVWQHLYDALSSTLEATTEDDWVRQWTKARDLKRAHRRAPELKRHYSHSLQLHPEHFTRVTRAAVRVGETPEALLVAMSWRVADGLRTWAKVAKANEPVEVEPAKILPFFRAKA
jgi:hypothetical protein